MATKICKECLRELDESMFKPYRNGTRICVCKDCVSQKMAISRKKWQDKGRRFRYGLTDIPPAKLFEELAYRGVIGKVFLDGNEFNLSDFNVLEQ